VRNVLTGLADVPGVRGSMVVTQDGMVVDSLLGKSLQQDVVGAMAATLILGTKRALEKTNQPAFESLTVVSTHGKILVADTGTAFLVVVLDRNIDLSHAELEIRSAMRKVKNFGEGG
jgi:predicted regulator of Ras-like GTPase activity (Roadblock/LC7/MglB family)